MCRQATKGQIADEFESLNHPKWECKYHILFIPKGRKKKLFGPVRRDLGEVFRRLAERKECPFDARSRAYADIDPTEIRRVACGWVHQGEKRSLPSEDVWRASAQFHGL